MHLTTARRRAAIWRRWRGSEASIRLLWIPEHPVFLSTDDAFPAFAGWTHAGALYCGGPDPLHPLTSPDG